MFEDSNTDRMSGKYENFVYITKSQADLLLSKYDMNNYKDLIDTEVTFYYGDNYESWKIANIFDDSVFIDKANAAFDNFVVCGYYYLPGEIKDKEKVLFAFDDSDFFNQIELKAIINNFSKDSFNFNFFNQILTIDQNVSSKVINLLNGRSNSVQGLFIALVSTGSILFLASCIFLLLLRKIKIEYFIFDILVLMSCWVLFKILSSFTFFEFTFSFTSLSIFLIFAMVVLIISLFLLLRSYFGRESNE